MRGGSAPRANTGGASRARDYPGEVTAAPLTDAEIAAIRAQFPILDREVNGHPLVYLDSAATAQKPRRVLDAERTYYENENAAVHRGAHTLAAEATELYEDARRTIAGFLAVAENEIVFTGNATEEGRLRNRRIELILSRQP